MMQQSEDRASTLSDVFRRIAEADAGLGAAPGVERRLRDQVCDIGARRRRRRVAAASALAAGLVVAALIPGWRRSASPTRTAPPATGQPARGAAGEVATAFLPLVYSTVPVSNAELVRMQVPRAALASFGLAPLESAATATGTVTADVLVGEDGLARAIRFVRIVDENSNP